MFWKKNSAEKLLSYRRIYKGEVPYLKDDDAGQLKKSSKYDDDDGEGAVGRPVRRLSFTPKPQSRKSSMAVAAAIQNVPVQPAQTERFPDNLIVSAKYTIWNFIPKNLFEQFRRVVNFYFLLIALIQSVIDSPVHPASAIVPFIFVIAVTAIKQGYEDWQRHKNDGQLNNTLVKVIRDGQLKLTKSRDIQVGDVMKLESDEQVPSDLLLIGSSDEFLRCQINTANLDGETNLKLRYCPSGLPHLKSVEELMNNLHIILECEQPNADLYEFSGSLLIPANKLQKRDSIGNGDTDTSAYAELMSGLVRQGMSDFLSIPLSMSNVLLRGTRLKNTEFIFGLVIYTGRDTRLARNSENSQSKFSTVEKAVNYYLIFFICLFVFLVGFSALMHFFVEFYPGTEGDDGPWYLSHIKKVDGVWDVINRTASFIPLFHYIIPISLYVTIELQKFYGSLFFMWDQDMVDEEGREPLANTSDLNEELGQIQYLFSDKTGTLTKNEMEFRHCSIDGIRYEYKAEDDKLYSFGRDGDDQAVRLNDSEKASRFFKTLALCHSVQVVPKRKPSIVGKEVVEGDGNEDDKSGGGMEYQASSPDEKALLYSCEKLGIRYCGEKEDMLTLDVLGQLEKYKRLMHLEFDADRKCMSVILEKEEGEKWLLTKGAESSIIPKCDVGPTQETLHHVTEFALLGLRTLAVAIRQLTANEFDDFNNELRAARRLIKNRQEKVQEVYRRIETHMTLIGATGVEDQLQDFVPETLQSFTKAGIRVWMLTGDKLETGVNVALSCGLMTPSTKQYIAQKSSSSQGEISGVLGEILEEMDSSTNDDDSNTCLVIDGDSLAEAFQTCSDLLRSVSMKASRVVCCRMTPLQKAQVVQMVKNSPERPICCAVGDGANDCAMILAAHVGIGILGKEGRQAARSADFALAKFEHLRKAILVHGHWFYVRLANLANYFFYKNVVFVLPAFYYSINSNFSTQALFGGLFLMFFNLFYASIPIVIYGILEQPYTTKVLLDNPQLYRKNKNNSIMTVRSFLPWLLASLFHSCVVYYLPYFSWGNFDQIDNVVSFGTVVSCAVVLVCNMKMVIETNHMTWWYFSSQLLSFFLFVAISIIYTEVFPLLGIDVGDNRHAFLSMLSSLPFWILILLVLATAFVPDIFYRTLTGRQSIASKNPEGKVLRVRRGQELEEPSWE